MLTAAVIGCGNIARFHFAGLEKAGVTIKWVCDLNEEAAAAWVARYNAAFTSDYRDTLGDVDVIVITTVSSVHKAICLHAIAAGKAVICEKTLAENPDDSRTIVSAAKESGTIFYTSYMKRFIPAVKKAKALLPDLGRILSTHIRTHQCWSPIWEANPDGFFHTPPGGVSQIRRNYGGGVLVCGGSHILDLVKFFVGRPHRLFASVYQPEDRDYDLQAAALMETPNGVVHFEALAHPLNKIGFLRDGWDERIEIIGTEGRLEILSAAWDQVEHKASMLIHYDNASGTSTEYRFEPCSPFTEAVSFFLQNIQRGTQGEQAITTGYDVDELTATIHASSAQERSLNVNYRLDPDGTPCDTLPVES